MLKDLLMGAMMQRLPNVQGIFGAERDFEYAVYTLRAILLEKKRANDQVLHLFVHFALMRAAKLWKKMEDCFIRPLCFGMCL